MFAQSGRGARPRSPFWTNRLWILSAALGAATLGSTAAIVHDNTRHRAAAQAVARSAAERVAAAAAERLQILALETFAPATPWEMQRAAGNDTELVSLVRAHHNAQRCQCRDVLPAEAFFRFDVHSGKLESARARPNTDSSRLSPTVMDGIARAEATRALRLKRSTVHFVATPPLGDRAAVTIVQSDQTGTPIAVYGLVADARALAEALFANQPIGDTVRSTGAPNLIPDSVSFEVRVERSSVLIGVLPADRPFRATVTPGGLLQGLAITVGLTRQQAVHSLFVSRKALWHLGVMSLATILVIGFAIGSSRRELLLARARSDFIAGVSHDLRMPLAQILIASETLTLRRERDEKERLTLSSSIVREARRLISIVDNVLLFSRSGAVALRPHLQPLAVSELFDDVIDAVRLAVEDARQAIEAQEALSVAVLGDRALVRQGLVNLVDNAIKYGASGQRIRLGAEQQAGGPVRLYVEDEGPGVPASERGRLFEPYERLARDQISERTGTGLGLAVVRHIAEVSGGRVWLEESPGGGTRAVMELPAAELPEPIVRERELV